MALLNSCAVVSRGSDRGRSDYTDPPGFFLKHVWPSYCSMERAVTELPGGELHA